MATTLDYAWIFTPTEVIERGAVVISDDGRIAYVGPMEDAPRADGLHLDLRGLVVVPGFNDVHVHGGNGISFGIPGKIATDLAAYSEWVVSRGVPGFLCSIAAPTAEAQVKLVSAFDAGKAINPLLVEGQIEGGAMMGLGAAFWMPAEQAWIAKNVDPEQMAKSIGGYSTFRGLVALPGPFIGGIVYDMYGYHGPLAINLVLAVIDVGLLWFLVKDNAREESELLDDPELEN